MAAKEELTKSYVLLIMGL